MAKAIQLGLESQDITPQDLLLTDSAFLMRLQASNSIEILQLLTNMSQPLKYSICSSKDNYDIWQKKKIRFVDPLVQTIDRTVPVSTLSTIAQTKIENLLNDSKTGIFLKFH